MNISIEQEYRTYVFLDMIGEQMEFEFPDIKLIMSAFKDSELSQYQKNKIRNKVVKIFEDRDWKFYFNSRYVLR